MAYHATEVVRRNSLKLTPSSIVYEEKTNQSNNCEATSVDSFQLFVRRQRGFVSRIVPVRRSGSRRGAAEWLRGSHNAK